MRSLAPFVERTSEPVRQGLLHGVGMWLAIFGFVRVAIYFRAADGSNTWPRSARSGSGDLSPCTIVSWR